jgi:transcriptional regulator GlxA family with amidase domain
VRTSSRNLAVLLFDEMEIWDVAAVMQLTSLAGRHWNWRPFRLLPTAEHAGLVETRSMLRLEARHALADCPAPEILLVPGGYGARVAAQNRVVTDWCVRVWPALDVALTIGSGALVLGAAGVLDGEEVAVTSENKELLATGVPGARCVESSGVVRSPSGKLLSCGSSAGAVELGLSLVERCLGARLAGNLRNSLAPPPTTRLQLDDQRLELPRRR